MHCAFVAKVDKVEPIIGADNIQIGYVLGERVVISKETPVGFTGLFFPPDLQLSEDFCHHNNLYRHSEKNADPTKKGFFDDNRKVRAQPFMKVKSEGFFCGLEFLDYLNCENTLFVGDTVTEFGGHKICEKYVNPRTKAAKGNQNTSAKKQNACPFFLKHMETDNFKHFGHCIERDSLLSFHAKIHGTSARYSYTPVIQNLNSLQKFVNRFIPVFKTEVYEYVAGTRNVVLSTPDKVGYHGSEAYRFEILELLKPYLVKGMTVYGEIAGNANGRPIMPIHSTDGLKNKEFIKKYGKDMRYSYNCKETEYRFHIYRITVTSVDGHVSEYSAKQVETWCTEKGFMSTVEVSPQIVFTGDLESVQKLVDELTERPELLTEDFIDPLHISEGIIVRVDSGHLKPKFYKSKSYAFRVLEGLQSEDVIDIESL